MRWAIRGEVMTNLIALSTGTLLTGDYRIERVLGAGGFGVTYLAQELALSRSVTIKEYFPADFAARQNGVDAVPRSSDNAGDFQWGLDRFIDEAQALAKLDHPNIVRVFRYFRANSTAYMVLKFEEGQSLRSWLKELGRAPRQAELDRIVGPLLDALEFTHKADYLHRDVAPDNIIIRRDGTPVLIDFGSARSDIIAHSKTVSALVKPGYSPYEQYAETSRQQGPWSDIYALGATLYHAVTGRRPPDSPSRMIKDEYIPARDAAVGGYRAGFLKAIDKALKLQIDQRPQSIAAWRGDLLAPDPVKQSWFSRGRAAQRGAGRDVEGADAPLQPAIAGPMTPPLPDAPGPQGGLLDFVDRLKAPAGAIGAPPMPVAAGGADPRAGAANPAAAGHGGPVQAPVKGRKSAKPAAVKAAAKAKAQGPKKVLEGESPAAGDKPAAKRKSVKPLVSRITAARAEASAQDEPQAQAEPNAATGSLSKSQAERVPQRPRPVRIGHKPASWSLFAKLALALTLAGGAVAFQDQFGRLTGTAPPLRPSAPKTAVQPPDGPLLSAEIRAHTGDIPGLAFSEDGRFIVSAARDATLKVWNAGNGSLLRAISLDNRLVSALALSGRRVVTGHGDGSIVLYDYEKPERIAAFKRNDAEVWSVAFLGSGDRFAAASHDYKTAVWEARNPAAPQATLEGHTSAAQAVAYSVHGPWIATGGADKTVRLYEAETNELVRTYKGPRDFVTALAFSPDGRTLAAASLDGDIRIYSTDGTRLRFRLQGHRGKIGALAFSADGELLASAGEDGHVRLWQVRRGRAYRMLTAHGGGATAVAFAPDGARVASAGADGMIRLWSIPPRKDED